MFSPFASRARIARLVGSAKAEKAASRFIGIILYKDILIVKETLRIPGSVFVLVSPERRIQPQFLVIPPHEMLTRLVAIHGEHPKYYFYPWVTESKVCLQGRGVRKHECSQRANGTLELGERDLTRFLGNWRGLERLAAHR